MTAAKRMAPPARAVAARPVAADRLLRLIHSAGGASRRLRAWLASRLARFDLTESEFLVLWLCSRPQEPDGWIQGNLAGALGLSPAQTSGLVERLRRRGLIDMKRSTIDRRRHVWHLLSEGEALLGRIRTGLESVAQRLDSFVSQEEQEAAARLFDHLVDAAERTSACVPLDADVAARETADAGGGKP